MAAPLKRTVKLCKRYYNRRTHQRYSGYINKWIDDEKIGHAVRNDEPDQEYFFTIGDIIIDPKEKSKFRPYVYEEIEFEIIKSKPKSIASKITRLHNKPLNNQKHQNMLIPYSEKTKKLIEEHEALHHRHSGVVFHISENGEKGYIMPDKLYCDKLHFHKKAIQSTGIQQLFLWAHVEFDIKPKRKDNEYDQAVCITRPRGRLITAEWSIEGNRRRYLGELYGIHDQFANIGKEFLINRKRGYIAQIEPERLYGFILVFDDNDNEMNNQLLHVHIDQCHMFGNRKLRRFQEVEFIISTHPETGRKMAAHVTGPNLEILRYHSENHFVSSSALFKKLDVNTVRHKGIVTKTPNNTQEPYIIKPNQYGCRPVIGYHGSIISLGSQHLERGDAVEFRISDNLSTLNDALQRAFDITSYGGYPLLLQHGEYGKYLQSKIGMEVKQHLLPEYGDNDESMYDVHGYIVNYNKDDQYGFIEVIAGENKRYKRMLFHLKDAMLKDIDLDYNQYQPIHTAQNKVIFTVRNIDDEDARKLPIRIKENDIYFTKKAVNIVTQGKNYLDLGLIKTSKQIHASRIDQKRNNKPWNKGYRMNQSMFAQCIECKGWKHKSKYSEYQWKQIPLNARKCKQCINKFYSEWKSFAKHNVF